MAIDRKAAVRHLSEIKVKGNQDGLILAFGVLIQFLPTNFWNTFSEKLLKKADSPERLESIERALENAAAECGYHTGWGIINSEEFRSVIGPMTKDIPEDTLHGAFAVLTAWGWADAEITELVPGTRMVIRSNGYYESEIADTFQTARPVAFMLKGICRAFMDIAYGKPYPEGLNTFTCAQVKSIELGDPYGEFVVTKA
jgi:hypothetical protein